MPKHTTPTPIHTETEPPAGLAADSGTPAPIQFKDPGVLPGDEGIPANVATALTPEELATRYLDESEPNPAEDTSGQVTVDELVAAFGAATLRNEKLQQIVAKQGNEIMRLRATLRNVISSRKTT